MGLAKPRHSFGEFAANSAGIGADDDVIGLVRFRGSSKVLPGLLDVCHGVHPQPPPCQKPIQQLSAGFSIFDDEDVS